MHAVVVETSIDDLGRARRDLTERVAPRASQAPGFVAGYWTRSERAGAMTAGLKPRGG